MEVKEKVALLVEKLHLTAHPEGGYYSETYRSEASIDTHSGQRNLSTAIFFLLTSDNVSKFHRIKSDELWFFHEGAPLTIHILNDSGHQQLRLGLPNENVEHLPYQLIKANTIFGSSIDQPNSYALVSCVVSPGFDFEDFELFSEATLLKDFPESSIIIKKLT